ncbi:metal-independent alpha-mannosidase [Erysipelothrix piscisicarius]|uniref:Metal-independent alpha-mannosidase n=1 Tax=Erysipelothrix piscisicarius TaxID=2485784 RepID=A0A3Q8S774_9FIRM|nr:glycoside hydrolase family 125 protein [Erysipelothrix piscisicarius]AZK43902.1 metal-independent alpha-mannosidase [Erysipelothrix piscisicarius]
MTTYNTVPQSVENLIRKIQTECGETHKAWGNVFENVFSNTLLTTVKRISNDDTFVLTGDIPAMWLRDSTAQIRPYLVLANEDESIRDMILGLINRQIFCINHEPYANAFNETENGAGHQTDNTSMTPFIWERKYEIDSLCYPIQLSYLYYQTTQDTRVFTESYTQAVRSILSVWETEQNHETSPYTFTRPTDRPEDTLVNEGRGTPVAYTGMTWSGFRPSDDACEYHYLVPSNMFAVVVLEYIEEIYSTVLNDVEIVERAHKLRNDIKTGIESFGVVDSDCGSVYAYEVDGLGNSSLIDDPNVPSLLSAPYLGYCAWDDPLYLRTRNHILSPSNRYYESEPCFWVWKFPYPKGYIWPIALAIEGLTTPDQKVKKQILDTLVQTDGGTKMMHESFNVEDPTQYTREWFSWANMMFCELVMDYFGIRVGKEG